VSAPMPSKVDRLRHVPLFASLDDRELQRLAEAMKERDVQAGREVVTQGSSGIGFFVILEGEAAVTVDGQARRTLGPGDHLGEVALIVPDEPRSATVTATTDVRLGALTAWEFKPFVESHPKVAWTLLETLARRLASTPAAS
jgi:CRP/FNR family transcriptional regulator, cyclic AMP receptor protein